MTVMTTLTAISLRSLLLTTLCTTSFFIPLSFAHMEMDVPSPWDSPATADAGERDYNIKSPLESDGSNFPCQGIDNIVSLKPSATYQAGHSYNMTIEGSANHNGGSCQLSLSYDQGKTWKVIKSMVGGCPVEGASSYQFTIPTMAPSGEALFAWTWINYTGNREFYMNCAVVTINGVNGGDLCMLPNMYVTNLAGINDCVSPEDTDTMFPHPGVDVAYGDGMSARSPPTQGNCEIPAPACGSGSSSGIPSVAVQQQQSGSARAQQSSPRSASASKASAVSPNGINQSQDGGLGMAEVNVGSGTASPSLSSEAEGFIGAALSATSTAADSTPYASITAAPSSESAAIQDFMESILTETPADTYMSIRVYIRPPVFGAPSINKTGCLPRPVVTVLTTASPPASTCTAPIVDCNCAATEYCAPVDACTTTCVMGQSTLSTVYASSISTSTGAGMSPLSLSNHPFSRLYPFSASSMSINPQSRRQLDNRHPRNPSTSLSINNPIPSHTPAPASSTSTATSAHPPYVTTDPNNPAFLPCTPGSFLCASDSSFFTCNQPAPPGVPYDWAWGYPRTTADGMMCLPFESPNATAGADGGPSLRRDDRYVRSRPDGDCAVDGDLTCARNGTAFWVCDQGGWIDMGDVAAGTRCADGRIVLA